MTGTRLKNDRGSGFTATSSEEWDSNDCCDNVYNCVLPLVPLDVVVVVAVLGDEITGTRGEGLSGLLGSRSVVCLSSMD